MKASYQYRLAAAPAPDAARLENDMSDYWDKRSESYSSQIKAQLNSPRRAVWEELIFAQAPEGERLRVLDIGTGPGFFALLAAQRGHEVTAVDMNPSMLEQARQNAKACGLSISFQQVGHSLPFVPESFDLILSRDVTWTLTAPESQLSSWSLLLREGGLMLYFDAEWNFYQRSEEDRARYEQNRAEVTARGGFCYSGYKKLETMTSELPLTFAQRPDWDAAFWDGREGFSFDVQENLNPLIYSELEQIQYELYPEFLVSIRRDK